MVTFFALNVAPLLLFYPAALVASTILLVKTIAVFVHDKEVQRWSVMVSSAEGTFESAYQFVFMFFIWFNGGQRELLSMSTSLVMIAKSRVEKHLSAETNPDQAMEEKTAREKAFLLAFFLPTFLITTIFRLTSLAIVFACLPPIPDPILSLYLYVCFYFAYSICVCFIINICSLGIPSIATMSILERGHAAIGKFEYFNENAIFCQQDLCLLCPSGLDFTEPQGRKYRSVLPQIRLPPILLPDLTLL